MTLPTPLEQKVTKPRGEKCQICGKTYTGGNSNISCLVLHAPGTCCHYGETEVKPPSLPSQEPVERELNDIQLKMLEKMLEWDYEYSYPYDYFDNIFDKNTLKKNMRGLVAKGYVQICRGGMDDDDGHPIGGTGFCLDYERIKEIRELVKERETTIETWKLDLERLLWSYHENGRPDGKTGVIGNPKTIEEFVAHQKALSRAEVLEEVRGKVEELHSTSETGSVQHECSQEGYEYGLEDVLDLLTGDNQSK